MAKVNKSKIANVKLETEITLPLTVGADDSMISSLLDDLNAFEASNELSELVEVEAGAVGDDSVLDDSLLDDIVAGAERDSQKAELYAEQPSDTIGDAPPAEASGKAKGKGKKKDAAPKEPKEPRATSVTHNPGDLLKAKLGAKAADFLVFSLTDDDHEAQAQAFVDRMNDKEAIAGKVKEKAIMFFTWLLKGGEPNEVIKRALLTLHGDGELTSGDKGNLQQNLLSKPYSQGTARSQANQMFMLFPELKLTVKEKGRMVPNPDSPLLAIANATLGLV